MITVDTLAKHISSVSWRYSMYDIFSDTVAMAAYCLANGLEYPHHSLASDEERREYWKEHNKRAYNRELSYLALAKKYNQQELSSIASIVAKMIALLSECTRDGVFNDHLGNLFMSLELGNKSTGQFFTPYHISKLSAMVTQGNLHCEGVLTVTDPCVGAGGMLLAAADVFREQGINYAERMLAYGCDVDIRCVQMAYLQLSWAGIPARIFHGNTITQEMWDVWETPAYLFNWLHFQPAVKRMLSGEIADKEFRPAIGPIFYFNKEEK